MAKYMLQGKGHAVRALAFSHDGSMLAVAAGQALLHYLQL